MKHIHYPHIENYRNVIKSVERQACFIGLDEEKHPLYDWTKEKPKLVAHLTIKCHGSNGAICYNHVDGMWFQSRENIITPEKDNAGFAFFGYSNREVFQSIFDIIYSRENLSKDYTISIFGEWAGKGVQKGVGITNLDKSFFIFGVKVSNPNDPDFTSYWVNHSNLRSPDNRVYNIEDYDTWDIEIDFNNPSAVQNKFVELVDRIEKECPVAKAFGFSGVGEGFVATVNYDGIIHRFKCKGQAHSVSKVKSIASVDTEKLNSAIEFADFSVTIPRVEQGIQVVCGSLNEIDITKMGQFIKWIIADICREELDTLKDNNLEPKDVIKYISNKAREIFLEKYNAG